MTDDQVDDDAGGVQFAGDQVADDPAGDDLAGVILCTRGRRPPTEADLATVREFAAFLRSRKPRAPGRRP